MDVSADLYGRIKTADIVGGKMSVFDSDPRFCPECGTIFPLPTGAEYISCMNIKCRYQVPESGL